MKKLFYFLLLVFIFSSIQIFSQVPNAGLENWTNGNPDMWITNNVPGFLTTVSQSNSAHSGSFALKGEVQNLSGVGNIPPAAYPTDGTITSGFAITQRYNSLKGYYKFNSAGNDRFVVVLVMYNGDAGVGAGGGTFGNSADYNLFQVPVFYDPGFSGVPTHCSAIFQIADTSNGSFTAGSEMYIDDIELSLEMVSGVEDEIPVTKFNLEQNYPNPFNPVTKINWQSPVGGYQSLKVYDLLGREVAIIVDEYKNAGSYEIEFDGSKLASGVYFYQLRAGDFVETRKMNIIK
jgi:hypothetical protein